MCSTFRVSIIIPTKNSSQHIADTCESLLAQRNCRWEAIVIDADSKDRTVEIVRSYESSKIRIQQVLSSHLFEMINRGIAMAQGEYVSILLPGDTYLFQDALATVMWKIAGHDFPDVFYTGSISYDEQMNSAILFRPFQKKLLEQALIPATLQSCWIKKSIFQHMAYFTPHIESCGALDFFLKLSKVRDLQVVSEYRVYVDCLPALPTYARAFEQTRETFSMLYHHFGLWKALVWLFKQHEGKKLVSHLIQKVKSSFYK
jgi:glycosyltransferase involved in cell wall biosynthesis